MSRAAQAGRAAEIVHATANEFTSDTHEDLEAVAVTGDRASLSWTSGAANAAGRASQRTQLFA
jgi:hypothetical protein